MNAPILCCALLLTVLTAGCGQGSLPAPAPATPSTAQQRTSTPKPADHSPKKLAAQHLPNPWQIHPKVISGGLPDGAAGFQELAGLGVKTVISVDGAKPDVARARKHGIRYVHLPHGYDGVPEDRMQELAKAVRDLPGKIYIHCHHGKHRSPAAAAVACVGAGLLDFTRAEPVLLAAGTSQSYEGLYESAREVRAFESALLDELDAEFPETAALPPLAEAMVALEHTHDHLKQVAEAGWKSLPVHPDIEPAHESLLLREHFTEMLRTDAVREEDEKFQSLMRDSEAAAQELEKALRAWKSAAMPADPPPAAAKAFERITANCKSCHTTYRDVPLSRKGKQAQSAPDASGVF